MRVSAVNTPAGFIENKGQVRDQADHFNKDVLFLYSGNNYNIQLRQCGFSYELFSLIDGGKSKTEEIKIQVHRVDVDFSGCNRETEIVKSGQGSEYLNYYNGPSEITGVRAYNKILYSNVYPFVDIEFVLLNDRDNPFKYNIILHPGANPGDVKFDFAGAKDLRISDKGLEIATSLGDITEHIPFSFYSDQPEVNIPAKFKLEGKTVSFEVDYDYHRTLTIDPSSNLIWSTYYGGTAYDYCTSTGVDGQDNVYIAGHSLSTSNIATNGAHQAVLNGNLDAYLAKFNSAGIRQWATYFGGSNFEQVFSIFVENNGNVYLTGDTFSSNNVASTGAHQVTYGGGIDDAMLVKFGSSGLRLWSTYFGGIEHDIAQGVTVDNVGNVIITGHTQSANMATPGSYNTVYSLAYDVFIAKFSSGGLLLWCTYYGDSGVDEAYGITTDAVNNIYITGLTESISGISTPGSHQQNTGGLADAYIAKFNTLGNTLLWGTYYGGPGNDHGNAIKIRGNGNIFVAGITNSGSGIATANAYQGTPGSVDDSFMASFNTIGVRQWGTYFGGEDTDYINDMTIDGNGNVIICGETLSTMSISTSGAYQATIASVNNYDGFFAKFSATGFKKMGSYFGGPSNDNIKGVSVNATGKIYLAGESTSSTGISTLPSHQSNPGGSQDGFFAKFCTSLEPLISPRNTTMCIGNNTLTATPGYSNYLWNDGSVANPLVTNNTTVQGTYTFAVFASDGYGCSGSSDTISIVIKDCYVTLAENNQDEKLRLHPNPATDYVIVEMTQPGQIEVYNSAGQLFLKRLVQETPFRLDISNFPPGLYFIRQESSRGTANGKFIRQ